ncbi:MULTISPECIES: prenyltransferase/squalene oxidase repeat-containing protein [unclassified Streptomyces]|uniref:prenyltransferase/squalene oxidase repeat-containing protein n=1 Tax=unclassified Streptomyces TaxID=2593676 RepID=UPI00087F3D58|nr:prenyltransferase/squalene oxidase-like repeat protein [Streptomyces sp. 2321.6]SDR51235.1 Prenyltransferase and squalene oxidase repeat-containing protein [Streptomyces sp. KS_16]SEC45431.1 Prenyltransferase and squalene oxidase repeat-containing protein [Streptomyces sp. 2133.1]SNC67582.1 Prenyltransferase and squalene oxidase repeat-containing protein [Streptomyces sp. 2114.4]
MAPMASMAQPAPLTHSAAFLARRAAAALAAVAVLGAAAAPAAYAGSASASPKKLPAGLYGTKDPQYDGVWRQSLALLAQDTVGIRPAASAVRWLAGQQCADGSFTAFRAEPGTPCDAKTSRDTNQTAAAVQALAALGGHGETVKKAVSWLKSVQNDDGGWSSMAGAASDANSTSVVIGALAAAGEKPRSVTSKKGGKTPYDALLTFRLGCEAKADARGAFTFQLKGAAPNADATAAAATGALGKGFVVEPAGKGADTPVKPLGCKDGDDEKTGGSDVAAAAQGGAGYLVAQLDKNGQHLLSAMPGAKEQPDVGNTADAVVALAAGAHPTAAAKPLKWLEKNAASWAKQNGPAAYAQLVLAAHATGTDPRSFGGTDLVASLNATGPEPAAGATKDGKDSKDADGSKGGGFGLVWIIGIGLAIGAGIGFLLSSRKKTQL